jgi:hypothetical protein
MEFCELYPDIKKYALEHKTPIIMEDSLEYIKELIKEKKILKILILKVIYISKEI